MGLKSIFKKKKVQEIDMSRLPEHIAFIMDGNGRWAKRRGLPRNAGHAAGSETFRRIATYCRDLGVKYLTVFAFSTENWKRPASEVEAIMGLLKKYLTEALRDMERDRVKIRFLGDLSCLDDELLSLVEKIRKASEKIDGVWLNICVNYGGRDEIVSAARRFAKGCRDGVRDPEELNEELFSGYLYSSGIPDPDIIIRTSGEIRLSNFLLWQSAYAELFFTDTLWPDLSEKEIDRFICEYQNRKRRFGGI